MEEYTRQTREEAMNEFWDSLGIDDTGRILMYHYEEEDVWEARYDGFSPRGETPVAALEALTVELRHAES